jgi:hypothetical protein
MAADHPRGPNSQSLARHQLGIVTRLSVHGLMMAGASGVVAASLLIVYSDCPHGQHAASLQRTAMRHTLVMVRNVYPGQRPASSGRLF